VQVSIAHDGPVAVATAFLEIPGTGRANSGMATEVPAFVGVPARPPDAHKGTFGNVVVVAGSLGLTGAAYLSSTAAARAGAGTVRLLVAETLYPILAVKCTEVMATPVAEVSQGAIGHVSKDAIRRHVDAATAALVGPGLGRDRSTWRLVHDLVGEIRCALVIDADGLNALAEQPRLLKRLAPNRVLTPHPGEMSRLTRKSVADLEKDRRRAASEAAREWGAVVVLKGARTVVAAPDGRISEDPHEVPALASGGTGDVLGGVIVALLAQGLDPFAAAVTGVYVHAEAGQAVSETSGDSGLLASDLLPELPRVMSRLRAQGLVSSQGASKAGG
jgi:NAD(P)H-hydrate epimerase